MTLHQFFAHMLLLFASFCFGFLYRESLYKEMAENKGHLSGPAAWIASKTATATSTSTATSETPEILEPEVRKIVYRTAGTIRELTPAEIANAPLMAQWKKEGKVSEVIVKPAVYKQKAAEAVAGQISTDLKKRMDDYKKAWKEVNESL